MSLNELQNGSEIIGVALDSFKESKAKLKIFIAQKFGLNFSKWLLNNYLKNIIIWKFQQKYNSLLLSTINYEIK